MDLQKKMVLLWTRPVVRARDAAEWTRAHLYLLRGND